MKSIQTLPLLLILAEALTGCVPSGPALNLAEFNDSLSGCFIADNYATSPCKVLKKDNSLAYQ